MPDDYVFVAGNTYDIYVYMRVNSGYNISGTATINGYATTHWDGYSDENPCYKFYYTVPMPTHRLTLLSNEPTCQIEYNQINYNSGDTLDIEEGAEVRLYAKAGCGYEFDVAESNEVSIVHNGTIGRILTMPSGDASVTFNFMPLIPEGSISIPTFDDEEMGYDAIDGKGIGVTLTHNTSLDPDDFLFELSGENSGDFEIIDNGGGLWNNTGTWNSRFLIHPKTGLVAGTHTAIVTLKYTAVNSEVVTIGSGEVSLIVTPSDEVSDFAGLQAAIEDDEIQEIIILNNITIPDGTILDGEGKTIRVASPYVKEDGTLEENPSASRVFDIGGSSTVTLKNMTIMGGVLGGSGAVSNCGTLTMENVNIVRSNRGLDAYGGGTNILKNCNFSQNVATSAGAIWCGNSSIVILDGCSFTQNRSNGGSSYGGGAIGVSGSGSRLYANNTVFANNATQELGGAINIYEGQVYLTNCTIVGNGTESSSSNNGGGIGKNSGKLYAANCIFLNNYANIASTPTNSDIGIFSGGASNLGLYNCLYGALVGNSYEGVNCKTDTENTTFNSYVTGSILRSNGTESEEFTYPELTEGDNEYDLFAETIATGPAATDGVATYFDATDGVKMGYGDSDAISALGNLTAPSAEKIVTTYFEGSTRQEGVIGASDVVGEIPTGITTWAQLKAALAAGGEVTLTQDIVDASNGGELVIPSDVTTILDLNGYVIDRNQNGRVFAVYGNLTINDSNPSGEHDPAITYQNPITEETVTLNGGIITGGNVAGILAGSGAVITMNGGAIAKNTTDNSGGGVSMRDGAIFYLDGGSIVGNSAPTGNGGAFWVYDGNSKLYVRGGEIKHNTSAADGGAIFLYNNQSNRSDLYLSGGTISENKSIGAGGAVYVNNNGGRLFVSGNPVVFGNKREVTSGDETVLKENNLQASFSNFVNIEAPLTEGAHIGVTSPFVPTASESSRFTSGYATYNNGEDPAEYFFCDYGEEYLAAINYEGEASFVYPVSTWEELRAALGQYGAVKLSQDIKASSGDTRINVGWCQVCLDLNGHVIDCSAIQNDSLGILVSNSHGGLTIIDSNPTAMHDPELSYIDPITNEEVVVNGGIITGRPSGTFTGTELGCSTGYLEINGGTILGKSTPGAHSLWVDYGRIYMNGGTICGNHTDSEYGGGVKIQSTGTMYLNGGTITGNTTTGSGGGIWNFGYLTVTGGEITNNVAGYLGGGIYNDGALTMSGEIVISGNQCSGVDSNLYLFGGPITVSGEFSENTQIGITTRYAPTLGNSRTFTSGFDIYHHEDDTSAFFTSDKTEYTVSKNSSGEACLEFIVPPVISGDYVCRTDAQSATIKFNSSSTGTYFYAVTDSDEVPTAEAIQMDDWETAGDGSDVVIGMNTIDVSGMTSGAKYLYVFVDNGAESNILTFAMPYDVYYFEGFESYPIDTNIGSGALSPMSQVNNGTGNANQKVIIKAGGGQELVLASAGNWASDQIIKWNGMLPSTGAYVFEGDVKTSLSSNETNNWLLRFTMTNGSYGSPNKEMGVQFKQGVIKEAVEEQTVLQDSFSKDSWYHIKIEAYPEANVNYVYIDGTKYGPFANPSGIDRMAITAGHGYTAYFDNLKYYVDPDAEAHQPTTCDVKVTVADIADGEAVEGALTQILSGETVIDSFYSSNETHITTDMVAGEYTIKVTEAPDGYLIPSDITFTIDDECNITSTGTTTVDEASDTVLVVELELTSVSIIVESIETNTALENLCAQIVDSEGNVVDEWSTTSESHTIMGLKANYQYTLRLILDGTLYRIDDKTFTIATDGSVTTSASLVGGEIVLYVYDKYLPDVASFVSSTENQIKLEEHGSFYQVSFNDQKSIISSHDELAALLDEVVVGRLLSDNVTVVIESALTRGNLSTASVVTAKEGSLVIMSGEVLDGEYDFTNDTTASSLIKVLVSAEVSDDNRVVFDTATITGIGFSAADVTVGNRIMPDFTAGFIYIVDIDGINIEDTIDEEGYVMVAEDELITYTISFDSNGGSGTMDDVEVEAGSQYTLPACTFSAPEGKTFDKWDLGKKGAKITINEDTILTAQWKNKVTGGGGSSGGSSSVKEEESGDEAIIASGDSGDVVPSGDNIENQESGETSTKPADQFKDVTPDDWFYENVNEVVKKGLFKGTSDTTFSPNDNLTRGMLVTVLYRLAGATSTEKATFDDVDENKYYSAPIAWANENGYVLGVGDNKFNPDAPITRQDLATIIYRYTKAQGKGFVGMWSFLLEYDDKEEISEYAFEPVSFLTMNHIIEGKGNNMVDPKGLATRAETAKIMTLVEDILD